MTFEKYKQIVKGRRLVERAVFVDVRKHGELHDYGEVWERLRAARKGWDDFSQVQRRVQGSSLCSSSNQDTEVGTSIS